MAKDEERALPCQYSLEFESGDIRLVARCRECDGKSDLSNKNCRAGIIAACANEPNIDSLALTRFLETEYTGRGTKLIKMLVQLREEISQLSLRDPADAKGKKKECAKCPLNPQTLFPELSRKFSLDITEFYSEFKGAAKQLSSQTWQEACVKCLDATESDFCYLFENLEEVRAFVMLHGYSVRL